MSISQYKKSMDEINVKKFEIEELLIRKKKKTRQMNLRKVTLAGMFIGILFCNFILRNVLPDYPKVMITAYAAEEKIQLTDTFVDFNIDVMPFLGGTDNGKNDFVNSSIHFKCEGHNIKSITYTCSDQVIDRHNRNNAPAYYVENRTVPIEEYNSHTKDKDFIYGFYSPGENTANITKIIGNSYSVNYVDQNNKQYGLILAATVDESGNFHINDAIIKIDIHFQNGSIQHKKLCIKSSKNVFSGIQLRIL